MPRKTLLFLFLLILFALYVWQGLYLPKGSASCNEALFAIEKGQTLGQITNNLKAQGFIKSKLLFSSYIFLEGASGRLRAGKYELSPCLNILQIAEELMLGQVVGDAVTIIPGWDKRKIAQYLEDERVIGNKEIFFENLRLAKWRSQYGFLKHLDEEDNWQIEGYLFPDTYFIDLSQAEEEIVEEIIRKALDNFEKKTGSGEKEITFDILIMASILEKELQDFSDKKTAAGILWKRMDIGMALQVDATLTYILGKKSNEFTQEDLVIDSPYNTYKYKGLPPAPICNPSLDSILAATESEESEFWYYLSTPEGETIFSKTLEEHNIAKQKYLK